MPMALPSSSITASAPQSPSQSSCAARSSESLGEHAQIEARLATLTEREREVLDLMVLGKQNKAVAQDLGVSPRTIEIHRARVMEKMHVQSVAELVRMMMNINGVNPR